MSGGAQSKSPAPSSGAGIDIGLLIYFVLWYVGNYYVSISTTSLLKHSHGSHVHPSIHWVTGLWRVVSFCDVSLLVCLTGSSLVNTSNNNRSDTTAVVFSYSLTYSFTHTDINMDCM